MLIKGLAALILTMIWLRLPLGAEDSTPSPKLLLNAQRLKRLKRDRERKTPRWVAFEKRVNNVPDSPERGFELALYYAITGDEAKGREAVQWGLAHADARQRALIVDWCGPLVSAEERGKFGKIVSMVNGRRQGTVLARNDLFLNVASGGEASAPTEEAAKQVLDEITKSAFKDASDLYAFCEYAYALRSIRHVDLREQDARYFAILPQILLLSAKPAEFNKPDWMRHAAALALVELDPNLPGSQFLQSWVMEDGQTVKEGPGVAYELLWADPYLPGVGYQNMESWVHDEEHGILFARASWEADSCWVAIHGAGSDWDHCPANWEYSPAKFGHLTLIPMTQRCVEIPHVSDRNDTVLVWKVRKGEGVTYGKGKEAHTSNADAAGIWRPGAAVEGKVCVAATR